jgi:ribosomal protein S20
MKTKKTIILFVVGALVVTVAFGAIAYQSVLAATPTTTTTATIGTTSQVVPGWEGGKGMHGGYSTQQLADALGITVDALNTAYQNAYSAALKDAVSKGLITQAQADQLTSNGSVFPFGDRWDYWLTQNGIDFNTYLADALGISVDALKAAYQTAYYTNIDQMVTAGSLTQTQADLMKGEYALYNDSTFQSSMKSAFTSAVNAAVSSGVITQSQADQILSNNSNMFMLGMDGFGGLGGSGGPHGHGGRGFMPDNDIPSTIP